MTELRPNGGSVAADFATELMACGLAAVTGRLLFAS
jgi:hypothetical protein